MLKNNREYVTADINLLRSNILCELSIFHEKIGKHSTSGDDYFDCFLKLRELLEEDHIMFLCQGSKENVWSSGMARQMSDGLKAYSLKIGERPTRNDLVEIFAPAKEYEISSVQEQLVFFEKWSRSVNVTY